jgi:hypothetical protein
MYLVGRGFGFGSGGLGSMIRYRRVGKNMVNKIKTVWCMRHWFRAIGEAAARTATDTQFKTFAISEFLPTPATIEIISSTVLITARRVGSQRGPRTRQS